MTRPRLVVRARLAALGRWSALLLAASVCAGCVGLPDSGPVESVNDGGVTGERAAGYLPNPPQPGESAAEIVDGFLGAMTASPPQTGVAEKYLSETARARWRPDSGMVVYGGADEPTGQGRVLVRLQDAYRLDQRGAYVGDLPAADARLTLPMELEAGEWRIAAAPNAWIVPQSWVASNYTRANIYYFDPTGQILVPEPVLVPRGDQLAGALAQSLLRGPGPGMDRVVRTFLPTDARHSLRLSVDADGVADVPLDTASAGSEHDAELAAAQLTWTLGQDPAISGLRISYGGAPPPGLLGVVDMSAGFEFAPTDISATASLFALRDGRLVTGGLASLDPVGGPFGQRDYTVQSFGVSLDADQVAAVIGGSGAVLLSQTRDPGASAREVAFGAGRVLRPAWDFADRLWLVDHPATGARLRVLDAGRVRTLNAPGLAGQTLRSVLVSRDGSRLVAVVRGARQDRVAVARIRHNRRGQVLGLSDALRIPWPNDDRPRIRDIAWRSPTSVTVLSRVADVVQARPLNVDRQPVDLGEGIATLGRQYKWLAGSPVPSEESFVAGREGVSRLASTDRTPVPIQGDPLTLTYVG